MRVSFVIPAFTVGRGLESVTAGRTQLPQGWDVEIIVDDDGSDDGPALKAALRDVPGVRLVEHSETAACARRAIPACVRAAVMY